MAPLALAVALLACAPHVDPGTMARLVEVETHGNPYALHDNATDAEYSPSSKEEALRIFLALKADSARRCAIAKMRGRYCLIDVGLAQVDESNFAADQVADLLDPRINLEHAEPLMVSAWDTALENVRRPAVWQRYVMMYGEPGLSAEQIILRAAFSIYNSNSAFGNPSYVRKVEAAGSDPFVKTVTAYADTRRSQRVACRAVAWR